MVGKQLELGVRDFNGGASKGLAVEPRPRTGRGIQYEKDSENSGAITEIRPGGCENKTFFGNSEQNFSKKKQLLKK